MTSANILRVIAARWTKPNRMRSRIARSIIARHPRRRDWGASRQPIRPELAVGVDAELHRQRQARGADQQPHRRGGRVPDDDWAQPRSDETADAQRYDRRPLHRCHNDEYGGGDDVGDGQDDVLACVGVGQVAPPARNNIASSRTPAAAPK